ncbi:regulator of G-protein signaling 12 [Gadus macrocephalus]|uniref:regulator of G-protein signaling 12 n=1 Tax=Gadus macrocephalus TaxID=80720 RepID=UPI0028CB7ABB|nr:regulator of G-protein signaling 12 [Gadus macrocephalus]
MRIMGQPEGVRRRLDLELNPPPGDVRHLEVVRGRAGYGFTVTGQGPCLLSAILEGGPGAQVGLKQGDRLMAVDGADVSHLPHETVVQLIGTCCNGPLRLAVLAEGRSPGTPAIDEDECVRKDLYRKAGVFRGISEDPAPPSVCGPGGPAETKPRPVSEPDLSRWAQRLDSLVEWPQEEGTEDGDSVCSDPDEAGADWSLLNMTMVVGYLSSTELLLSRVESEESCLEAIRQCIRQLGTEQDTHTLVLMKVMFDCVRLCDDAGAVLAAFPAENLLLGAVCAEDGRFFCLVTTAHVSDVRPPQEGPLRASCHVFFVDPELGCHRDHMAIAGRFGFRCTPDPDAAGCLEFPPAPQEVLHFVSVLYGDMGEAVERIRVRLDAEALPPAPEDEDVDEEGRGTGKGGSASSTGDSGIGNASPPEERTERDFPPLAEAPGGSHAGVHLPSCPWDYPADEELAPRGRAQTTPSLHCNPDSQLDEGFPLTESLPGPDALSGFYGGPPPRLEFQFKPPPPPLPPGKKQNFLRGPLRNSQRWFSRQKGPKGHGGAPEPKKTVAANVWPSSVSLAGINANFLPPPMSHINTGGYGLGNPGAMLPPKEDWTKRFLEQSTRHAKEGHSKGPRSWSKGARSSARRPGQRLSMARSLDDLESAASSDGGRREALGEGLSLRAGGAAAAAAALPGEKRKQKKINIDEAEEFFELLSRAQSSRANDQRGLLSKEDLVLPDFLRLAPPTSSASSTPRRRRAARQRGRENGPRGPFGSSLRSESLDSPLGGPGLGAGAGGSDGHSGGPSRRGPAAAAAPPALCLPEANFTPPPPCTRTPLATAAAAAATPTAPSLGAPEGQTTASVTVTPSAPPEMGMDMEGVRLEEGVPLSPSVRGAGGGVCPELSLSFQGYVEELRQCQSKMRNAQGPQAGGPTEDPKGDPYKATIV